MTYQVDFLKSGEDLLLGLINYDNNPKSIPHQDLWPKAVEVEYTFGEVFAMRVAPTVDWMPPKDGEFIMKKELSIANGNIRIRGFHDDAGVLYVDGVRVPYNAHDYTDLVVSPGQHTFAFVTIEGPGASPCFASFIIEDDGVKIEESDFTWPCIALPVGFGRLDYVQPGWKTLTPTNVLCMQPPIAIPPIERYVSGKVEVSKLSDYHSHLNHNEVYWPMAAIYDAPVKGNFQEVFEDWDRFSHGAASADGNPNYSLGNAQPANLTELNSWTYDGINDAIVQPINTGSFVGFTSPETYDDYTFDTILGSTNTDNDLIGVILGYYTDVHGRSHTLSFSFCNDGRFGSGRYAALCLNEQQTDVQRVFTVAGPLSGVPGWSVSGQRRMTVVRVGDNYTVTLYKHNEHKVANTVVQFNLVTGAWNVDHITDDFTDESGVSSLKARTALFAGKQSVGYCANSQADSTYINLQRPGEDSRNNDGFLDGAEPLTANCIAPENPWKPEGGVVFAIKKRVFCQTGQLKIRGYFDDSAKVYVNGVKKGDMTSNLSTLTVNVAPGEYAFVFDIPQANDGTGTSSYACFEISDNDAVIEKSDASWFCELAEDDAVTKKIGYATYYVKPEEDELVSFTPTIEGDEYVPTVTTVNTDTVNGVKVEHYIEPKGSDVDWLAHLSNKVQPKNTHTVIRTKDDFFDVKDVTVMYNRIPLEVLFSLCGIQLRENNLDMLGGSAVLNDKVFAELERRYGVRFTAEDFRITKDGESYNLQARDVSLAYQGATPWDVLSSLATRVPNTVLQGFLKEAVNKYLG